MSERYEISGNGDGTYLVIDTDLDQPVFNNGGNVYSAPRENAQWTADYLNRAEARKLAPLAEAIAEVTPEPEPDDLADWERELLASSMEADERSPETIRADRAEARLFKAQTSLERAEAEIAQLKARVERRHEASLRYAARVGSLRADLASVRARLVGTIDGMLPSLRRTPTYGASAEGHLRALNLINESLSETREFISKRLDESDF